MDGLPFEAVDTSLLANYETNTLVDIYWYMTYGRERHPRDLQIGRQVVVWNLTKLSTVVTDEMYDLAAFERLLGNPSQ